MEKLKMHSKDMSQDNLAKIKMAFPNCITERRDAQGQIELAVDFDLLRQELSSNIVEGPQERYRLDWPGKRESMLAANAPIAKTLRPARDESVNFDDTENLFIEGDNLDALKLLQENYLSKIKMIYIDPPYNRKKGNNLVYRDDFVGNTYEYLMKSNQADVDGNKLLANTESNGRFHSDWLGMMYQRLRLVKNLLSDNGVVVISIDDAETANVLHLCYEIFGEQNFVGTIIWKNATDNNPTNIAIEHESIHVFASNKINLEKFWKSSVSDVKEILLGVGDRLIKDNPNSIDDLRAEYSSWFRENKSQLGPLDRYKYIDYGGVYTGSQSVHNPGKEGYRYDVLHPVTGKACKEPLMGYRFPEKTMKRLLDDEKILFGNDESKIIELKVYAYEFEDKLSSVFDLDGRTGPYELRSLFPEDKKIFSNPKPVILMERLISFASDCQDVCLDLFAGSSTFSHALLNLNRKEGSNRKFISIQYQEKLDESNQDSKEALRFCRKIGLKPFISEVSKERIRRAGQKILEDECHRDWNQDIGFRVLKVDTSNMKEVYYQPQQLSQEDLFASVDNIKTDRTSEDLLFQVLLDWGVDLTLPIRRETLQGKEVFIVDDNALVACFEQDISEALINDLAELNPLRAVFRDTGFATDAVKVNATQIFKQRSPITEIKAI